MTKSKVRSFLYVILILASGALAFELILRVEVYVVDKSKNSKQEVKIDNRKSLPPVVVVGDSVSRDYSGLLQRKLGKLGVDVEVVSILDYDAKNEEVVDIVERAFKELEPSLVLVMTGLIYYGGFKDKFLQSPESEDSSVLALLRKSYLLRWLTLRLNAVYYAHLSGEYSGDLAYQSSKEMSRLLNQGDISGVISYLRGIEDPLGNTSMRVNYLRLSMQIKHMEGLSKYSDELFQLYERDTKVLNNITKKFRELYESDDFDEIVKVSYRYLYLLHKAVANVKVSGRLVTRAADRKSVYRAKVLKSYERLFYAKVNRLSYKDIDRVVYRKTMPGKLNSIVRFAKLLSEMSDFFIEEVQPLFESGQYINVKKLISERGIGQTFIEDYDTFAFLHQLSIEFTGRRPNKREVFRKLESLFPSKVDYITTSEIAKHALEKKLVTADFYEDFKGSDSIKFWGEVSVSLPGKIEAEQDLIDRFSEMCDRKTKPCKKSPVVVMGYPNSSFDAVLARRLNEEGLFALEHLEPFRTIVAKDGFYSLFLDHFGKDTGHMNDIGRDVFTNNIIRYLQNNHILVAQTQK